MKRNVLLRVALAAMLSLTLLLASCEQEPASVGQTTNPTGEITKSTADTERTDAEDTLLFFELRVCLGYEGKLFLVNEDSEVYVIPYDETTYQIVRSDGTEVIDVRELALGDRVRVEHTGEATVDGFRRFDYIRTIVKTLDASLQQGNIHGVVVSVGDTLLVHPHPETVLDIFRVSHEACYEIPLQGVPLVDGSSESGMLSAAELKVGDFVEVKVSQSILDSALQLTVVGAPKQLSDAYSISRCKNTVKLVTVGEINGDRLFFEGVMLGRTLFDEGKVRDPFGRILTFEQVKVGDVLEVQFSGEVMLSSPGQYSHIHTVKYLGVAEGYPTTPIQPREEG